MWCHYQAWTSSTSSVIGNSWWHNIFCENLKHLFGIDIQSQLKSHHQVQKISSDHAKFEFQMVYYICDGLLYVLDGLAQLGESTLRWFIFCPFLDFFQSVSYSNAINTL
jgi:hypothetical protein